MIEWLIKKFEWLTNKLEPPCNRMGIPVRLATTVVSFIVVYILITFIPVVMKWTHIVEWMRNGLLGIGALIGLWIAYYRTDAMQKQAEAANEQVKTANEQAKVANEQAKIANQQSDLAEKRYASEQFSQGVTLLAEDNKDGTPAIGVRGSGIYGLARLGEADPKGYGAEVMKALVAYIRNNAQRTALPPEKDRNKSVSIYQRFSETAHLGEDVKAAFATLKRLHSNEKVRDESKVSAEDLSFSHANFRALRLDEIEWIERPDLSQANLSGANLNGANLQGAMLYGANLQDADLWHAELIDAKLHSANLQGANLEWVNLEHARLHKANLQGANLEWSNLQDAILEEAKLQGADFMHAILQNTNFDGAIAIYTTFEDADLSYVTTEDGEEAFNLNKPGIQVSDETVQKWKAWFSNYEFLPNGEKLQSLALDAEWDLDFLEEMEPSNVVFILEGILRNFAEEWYKEPSPRTIECRKAVKQWVEQHNLWEHFSDDWGDWL